MALQDMIDLLNSNETEKIIEQKRREAQLKQTFEKTAQIGYNRFY